MSEEQTKENNYINNEYRTVTVTKSMESIWRDAFACFGWRFGKSEPAIVKHVWGPFRIMLAPLAIFPGSPFAKLVVDHKSGTKVELKFRRDRDIPKKSEINQLQSRFEVCVAEINHLQAQKTSAATAVGYIIGFVGTVFMGISVFSYLGGILPISILSAVPGFGLWISSYFSYQAVKGNKTRKVSPLIEKQYETINDISNQAYLILHAEKTVG